jgi:hypothetical protein
MFKKLYLVLVLGLASANVLYAATTYYVSKTGSDSANGSSGSPWLTIGHAAGIVSAGDVVNIGAGTYSENVTLSRSGTSGSRILFIGPSSVIVRSFNFTGNYITVSGVSINANNSDGLTGVSFRGTGCTLTNCNVTGCYDTAAVQTDAGSQSNLIVGCVLHDMHDVDVFRFWGMNNVVKNNEIYGMSNPGYSSLPWHADIVQIFGDNNDASQTNIFEGNYIHDCNGQSFTMSQDSRSNIHDNTYRNNILVNIENTTFMGELRTRFYNNLFINVGGVAGYALGFYKPNSAWDPTGSIAVNNVFITYDIGFSGCSASSFLIDNNYFGTASYGALGTIGTHAVNGGNPRFAGTADYHILVNSVLRGAGTNMTGVLGAPVFDKDGVARPASGAWDIGPYQYAAGGPGTNPVIQVSPATLTFGPVPAGASATNTFTVQNAGAGTLSGTATVATAATNCLKVLSGGTYSLGAGQSQVIAVRYTPTGAATDSGSITCSGGGGTQVNVTGSLLAAALPSPPQNLRIAAKQ